MSIELSACELDEIRHQQRIKDALDRQNRGSSQNLGFKSPPVTTQVAMYRFKMPKKLESEKPKAYPLPSNKHGWRRKCHICGRTIRLVDGKMMAHRSRQDEFGAATGPFCEYNEINV